MGRSMHKYPNILSHTNASKTSHHHSYTLANRQVEKLNILHMTLVPILVMNESQPVTYPFQQCFPNLRWRFF